MNNINHISKNCFFKENKIFTKKYFSKILI